MDYLDLNERQINWFLDWVVAPAIMMIVVAIVAVVLIMAMDKKGEGHGERQGRFQSEVGQGLPGVRDSTQGKSR